MKELHEKFINSTLSQRLTLSEISHYIIKVYKANVISTDMFRDLKDDSSVNFNNITHCFAIPEEVVNKLRSNVEKSEIEETIKLISQYSSLSQEEKELAIYSEKGLKIILESSDQVYLDNFTIQGESEKLLKDMIYLQGLNPSEYTLENEDYIEYLKILNEKGLI